MTTRTVKRVVRRGTRRRAIAKDFQFTKNMFPFQNGDGEAFIRDYRAQAWDVFKGLPLPHTKLEPWRRTDLRRLQVDTFQLPREGAYQDLAPVPKALLAPLVGKRHGGQLVLVPGGVRSKVSQELVEKGVIFTDFVSAEREHPNILAKILGRVVRPDAGKFAALTGAMAQSGVLIYVPRNVEVEQPLHTVVWAPGVGLAHFSHLMIWLEDGASLTYVHETASPTEIGGQTLFGGIVETHVGANAHLRFVELQSLGEHVWNFTHERIEVGRDSNLDWIFGAMGSHLTKNFSDLDLIGKGAHGRMSGFYFTSRTQHLDHDTQQNHLAPYTTSDLLFKGVLRDKSRSVWQGMIYVAPEAQRTDGYQANRNLVLDQHARADSIPGLEILADDVRCTHGATVGKIDPELIFYLRSRGVPKKEAERLIVEGFFDPVMKRIPYEGVRKRFEGEITNKINLPPQ